MSRPKGDKEWRNLTENKCPLCSHSIEPAPLKKEKIVCTNNYCGFVINVNSIPRIVENLDNKEKRVEYMKLRANLLRDGKTAYARKIRMIEEIKKELAP